MAKERHNTTPDLHAGSIAGDPRNAEGAIEYSSFNTPAGKLLGQPTTGMSRDQPPVGARPGDTGSHGVRPLRGGAGI